MGIRFEVQSEKVKIALIAALLAVACFLLYYFHFVLQTRTLFTHFFYIPALLAAFWWQRRGLVVAIFLAIPLVVSHIFIKGDMPIADDYFRASMLIVTAVIVAVLSEQIGRAKGALQKSEQKLLLTFESIAEGVGVTDLHGNFTQVNEAVVGSHGYNNKKEILGRSALELIAEKDRDRVMEQIKETLELGYIKNVEYTFLRRDGSEFDAELSMGALKDGAGNPIGFVGITSDIAKRRRAEDALQESEVRYRTLFASVPVGISMATEDGKILANNDAMLRMTGYSAAELRQINMSDIYQNPEEREQLLKQIQAEGSVHDFEVTLKRKDGTPYYASLTVAPFTLGDRDALLTVLEDITERKLMEERARHLNQLLHTIFNISEFIARERDRDSLLKGVCDTLIETRGYHYAWAILLDEFERPVVTAEAGLDKKFLPMVKRWKRGRLPVCSQRALEQSEVVVTEDPSSSCADCPLADKYGDMSAVTVRLEYSGKVYGLLSCSIDTHYAADDEEQSLLQRTAGDIAFALHSIELEEQRRRAVDSLVELTRFL